MVTPGPRYRKINRPVEAEESQPVNSAEDDALEADVELVTVGDDGDGHHDADGATDEGAAGAGDDGDEVTGDEVTGDDGTAPTAFEIRMATYEDEIAARRRSTIANARRKGGVAGAAMAGAMLAVQEIIEAPKEDAPVVVEANSDPEDFESDGITMHLDGTEYHAPPLDPVDER